MKLIELTQNRVACVDDDDFVWLSQWNWYYKRDKKTGYAARTDRSGKQQTIRMHIAIMRRHKHWKNGQEIDHINTCGCDNRKVNLRLATPDKQSANRKQRSDNVSGVTGVHWHKLLNKWRACIGVKRKLLLLGDFVGKKEAIEQRRQAEIKYFGKYRYKPKQLCPLWKIGQCPDCAKRAQELGLKP